MQWLPKAEDVVKIHEELVRLFNKEEDPISPSGVKSHSLLESGCNRPMTGSGTVDKYPSIELKLAALFHSLTKNHAFHNGNKRTALVALLTGLYRNDRILNLEVTDDELFDFVLAVTKDEYPKPEHGLGADDVVHAIAQWIKKHSVAQNRTVPSMKTAEFLKRCISAGAVAKESNGRHVISNAGGSIGISKSTRQLSGPVIRTYLRKLHLHETGSGLSLDEFQDGASDERGQIHRFIVTLIRLAKT